MRRKFWLSVLMTGGVVGAAWSISAFPPARSLGPEEMAALWGGETVQNSCCAFAQRCAGTAVGCMDNFTWDGGVPIGYYCATKQRVRIIAGEGVSNQDCAPDGTTENTCTRSTATHPCKETYGCYAMMGENTCVSYENPFSVELAPDSCTDNCSSGGG